MRPRPIWHDERGAGAVEFALIAPVLLGFIIGIAQLGILFIANAGLRNAVAEGARLAAIYPTPPNDEILARITDREFGLDPGHIIEPTIDQGTDANGNPFLTITMGYNVPLDFVLFEVPPVTLTEARRVYTQASLAGGSSGGSTSSTGSSTSTSTGGWGDGSSSTSSSSSTSTSTSTSTGGGNSSGNGHGHGNG